MGWCSCRRRLLGEIREIGSIRLRALGRRCASRRAHRIRDPPLRGVARRTIVATSENYAPPRSGGAFRPPEIRLADSCAEERSGPQVGSGEFPIPNALSSGRAVFERVPCCLQMRIAANRMWGYGGFSAVSCGCRQYQGRLIFRIS